jgi:hypothetical protein
MRWPWSSTRDSIVAVLERQNERLHRQVRRQQDMIVQLQQHNVRIDRKEHGLSEEPRKQKPRDEDPAPPEVCDYLEAFDSPEMRANVEDDINMARSQGTPWSEIAKVIGLEVARDVLT